MAAGDLGNQPGHPDHQRGDDQEHALAQVRRPALHCVACKLSQTRTQVVFGVGDAHASLVVVGQSPGEQEDRTGAPFVGPAGGLLNECLGAVGLSREDLYITNVVKCRPYVPAGGGRGRNRDPEPDEIHACRPWIEAELAILRPRVIVCAGGKSAELVLGRPVRMTRERGQWFADHAFRPAQVMPILHPAYILRQHGPPFDELRQQLIDDLAKAKAMAERLEHTPRRATDGGERARSTGRRAAEPVEAEQQQSLFEEL